MSEIDLKRVGYRGITGAFNHKGVHCIVLADSKEDLVKIGSALIKGEVLVDRFQEGAMVSAKLLEMMEGKQ